MTVEWSDDTERRMKAEVTQLRSPLDREVREALELLVRHGILDREVVDNGMWVEQRYTTTWVRHEER